MTEREKLARRLPPVSPVPPRHYLSTLEGRSLSALPQGFPKEGSSPLAEVEVFGLISCEREKARRAVERHEL